MDVSGDDNDEDRRNNGFVIIVVDTALVAIVPIVVEVVGIVVGVVKRGVLVVLVVVVVNAADKNDLHLIVVMCTECEVDRCCHLLLESVVLFRQRFVGPRFWITVVVSYKDAFSVLPVDRLGGMLELRSS